MNLVGIFCFSFIEPELTDFVEIWTAVISHSQRPPTRTVGCVECHFEYDADGITHFTFEKK